VPHGVGPEAAHIASLFAKELVLRNFPGQPSGEPLERMVELSLFTE